MTGKTEKKAHIWKRDSLDWYVEPTVATEQLLTVERFVGGIHDPCCGGGNIVTTLRAAGYAAAGTDIVDRSGGARWFCGEYDFLSLDDVDAPNIVFNPPFFNAKGAEAFIRHALSLTSGKVAAFVDIRFVAGSKRANGLFAEFPPARIWAITPRVSCPPGEFLLAGGKAGNGSSDWCWIVWDKTTPARGTDFGWLRRRAP